MFQDTAGTIAAAVGQPVARINDKSGRGHNATQAAAAQRPILRQHATTSKYYLEFDGVDDNLVTSVAFGSTNVVSTFAALRNRAQTSSAGILEMLSTVAPGPSTLRIRQRASASTTVWDALLSATSGEGTATAATFNTTAPNSMIMSSQHDIPGDLSTMRVNGVAGFNGTGDKGTNALGTVTVNFGKLTFRPSIAADVYGLIVRGALTADPVPAEYWLDTAMGGGVMPPYVPPAPPLDRPDQGFARELGGRFPWMAFAQPTSQFTFWSEVGVNVLDTWNPDVSGVTGFNPAILSSFKHQHEVAAEEWDSAAISAGFKIARHPFTAARAAADLVPAMRQHVVGWPVQDEPEGSGFDIAPQLALLDAADPTFTVPRAMNNTGASMVYQQAGVLFPYFNQFSAYDAVQAGFDFYPVQGTVAGKTVMQLYRPNGQPYTATFSSRGLLSARLEEWDLGGVPTANWLAASPYAVFIATGGFVDTSQPELRVPTPQQVRFQIADAIVMGAEAISFFPQRFDWVGGVKTFTSYNATPADVKLALTQVITRWKLLETGFATNLLVNPANNRIWPSTYRVCPDTVPSGQQTTAESGLTFAAPPTSEYLPGPFQGSKRVTSLGNVYFIQNLMDEPRTLTDATWGFAGVAFAARETLVFFEANKANAVWSDISGIL